MDRYPLGMIEGLAIAAVTWIFLESCIARAHDDPLPGGYPHASCIIYLTRPVIGAIEVGDDWMLSARVHNEWSAQPGFEGRELSLKDIDLERRYHFAEGEWRAAICTPEPEHR